MLHASLHCPSLANCLRVSHPLIFTAGYSNRHGVHWRVTNTVRILIVYLSVHDVVQNCTCEIYVT